MKPGFGLLLLVVLVSVLAYLLYSLLPGEPATDVTPSVTISSQPVAPLDRTAGSERVVLDISVHTEEEMRVLLERAGQLAGELQPAGEQASIVLVLHGPEVEFFSTANYERYRDIVDQAARLDALDIVDVKICQAMMQVRGVERDDIPSFIEQVPLGSAEVDRLVREGYVYF